jgi:hypothetical protein
VVVDEDDILARFDIPVLESIVQHDDLRRFGQGGQPFDTPHPVGIAGDEDIGKLAVNLQRLVSQLGSGGGGGGKHESGTLALVAPAEACHSEFFPQGVDEQFRVRRLAGAADGDVADAEDGYFETTGFEDSRIE